MTSSRSAKTGPIRGQQTKAAHAVAKSAAQEVRIIGGQWKRTPLPVPVSAGLRPTPSRVRETLFNWLGQNLSGWRVLDAFAGSGALGLEAASRGADEVWLIEREPALVRHLQASKARLSAAQVQIAQADALSWMQHASRTGRFDLVLLDPPFDESLFWASLDAALSCVAEGGWVYLEASAMIQALPMASEHTVTLSRLQLHKHGQAGAVHFHLFQRVADGGLTLPAAG